MSISIDQKMIVLKPNLFKYNELSNIQINNSFGEVSVNVVKNNLTDEQIDSLIDSLKLAKSISRHIKESFE